MSSFALQLADRAQSRWTFSGPGAELCRRITETMADFETLNPVTRTAVAVHVREVASMRDAVAEWPPERIVRRTRNLSARLHDDEAGVDVCIAGALPEERAQKRAQLERLLLFGLLPLQMTGKALVFHGALLVLGGNGVVITGASGVGKSTCAARIPPPWEAWADDMVLMQRCHGEYYVQGLPTWSQLYYPASFRKVKCNRIVPLRGIFELQQAPTDQCFELPYSRKISLLATGFHEFWVHWGLMPNDVFYSRLAAGSFDFCRALARNSVVKGLKCSLTGTFWSELEKEAGIREFL